MSDHEHYDEPDDEYDRPEYRSMEAFAMAAPPAPASQSKTNVVEDGFGVSGAIGGDDTEDETPRPQYRGVQYHALCEAALATERQDDDAAPSGAAPRAELGGVTAAHAGARFGVPDETEHDEDDDQRHGDRLP